MDNVTLDSDLRSRLNGMNNRIEVRDEGGRTVGYFLPAEEYERLSRLLHAHANSLFTDEELDRAEREQEEYTTQEVLDYLGKL